VGKFFLQILAGRKKTPNLWRSWFFSDTPPWVVITSSLHTPKRKKKKKIPYLAMNDERRKEDKPKKIPKFFSIAT
jgi:hypothetical protein